MEWLDITPSFCVGTHTHAYSFFSHKRNQILSFKFFDQVMKYSASLWHENDQELVRKADSVIGSHRINFTSMCALKVTCSTQLFELKNVCK